MKQQIIQAAALVLLDEVVSLLKCIETTGTVPQDRIPGLKERLNNYKTILQDSAKVPEK